MMQRKFFGPFLIVMLVFLSVPACAKKRAPIVSPPGTFAEEGMAIWYGKEFQGRKTASGERINMYDLTAAHPSLPFGTRVKVTNLQNGKSVIVRINDRGPNTKGRIIDLSYAAAQKIGMVESGVAKVRIEVLN
jgi:rare lipoprotein A